MGSCRVKYLTSNKIRDEDDDAGATCHVDLQTVIQFTSGRDPVRGLLALLLAASSVAAASACASGRLAATGGLAEIDGAGGGGLTPWALIAGLGTEDEVGGSAHCTDVRPQDFSIVACGISVGLHDRLELSLSRLHLSLGEVVPGRTIDESVVGVKYRISGQAVVDQDRWMPQISAGAFLRHNSDFQPVARSLGAHHASGAELYVAATKIVLAGPFSRTWLLNATARLSNANQFGLLGFGGSRGNYRLLAETSVIAFVADHVALGAEYRQKPDNLPGVREDGASAVVLSVIPNKHCTITAGYANLGHIAGRRVQDGLYISVQAAW